MCIDETYEFESRRNNNYRNKSRRETMTRNTSQQRSRSVSLSSLGRQRSISVDMTMKKSNTTYGNSKRTSPITPVSLLCYTVMNRDEILLEKLLKNFPFAVNQLTEDGLSPLHLASMDGNIRIMELLLTHGAKVDLLDCKDRSALEYAVWGGQFDAAQLLIKNGCDSSLVRDGFGY